MGRVSSAQTVLCTDCMWSVAQQQRQPLALCKICFDDSAARARTHTIQITLKHVDFTLAGGQCTANFMPVVCFVIAQKMEHLLASHSAPYRSFWCFDKMQMQVKAHSFRMWAACDCCDIVAHTRIIYNWRISKSRQLSWQRIISSLGFWAH